MSMSVGASSGLSYLQSLMQQGNAKEAKKTAAPDPLSVLMQAMSGEGASSTQLPAGAQLVKMSASATAPQFSRDIMSALLSAQGDESADKGQSANHSNSIDKNAVNLLDRLTKLQSAVTPLTTPNMLAVA